MFCEPANNPMEATDPKSQCTATSKTSGKRCGRSPIPGGNVCRFHGGAAPQVKKAAELRLAALVDPAIATLSKLLKAKSETARLGAVRDVLDRNGFKPADRTELTGADGGPMEHVIKVRLVKSPPHTV